MNFNFDQAFKNAKSEEEIRGIPANWQDTFAKCYKREQHEGYKFLFNFTQENVKDIFNNCNIPSNEKTNSLVKQVFDLINKMAALTTYIEYTLGNGSSRSCGTGFVQRIRLKEGVTCPCNLCTRADLGKRPKSWAIFTVTSVHHMTRHLRENQNSVLVKLFYDLAVSNPNELPHDLYLHKVQDTDKEGGDNDWCALECVSHDQKLIKTMTENLNEYEKLQKQTYKEYTENNLSDLHLVAITGHPHGMPKQVSLGTWKEKKVLKDVRDRQEWCRYAYTTPTCPGSSGSPVFILGQPLCGFGYWFGHTHNHSRGNDIDKVDSRGDDNFSSIGTNQMV